jgi:signal peptidase II
MARRPLAAGLACLAVVIGVDQVSKALILDAFRPPGVESTPFVATGQLHVLPILDFALVWNRGVSFGVANTGGAWNALVFAAISAVIALVLLVWMARAKRDLLGISLGLITGGAVGNLMDRLRIGAVVDFIYVHIGAFDWFPAFNVADSSITVGAAALVIDSLFVARD